MQQYWLWGNLVHAVYTINKIGFYIQKYEQLVGVMKHSNVPFV